MSNIFQAWMLPEGILEALPKEANKLTILERQAIDVFSSWGYRRVIPPMIEHLDGLVAGANNNSLLEQTIQFKDPVSGKQLGIRADITPQIARIDAHYLKSEKISRYSYSESVVRSYPSGYGGSRNPTLSGVELFGSACWEADFEVISLLVEYLKSVGLKDFVIDLGNVDITTELLIAIGVSKSRFGYYFDAISKKDRDRINELAVIDNLKIGDSSLLISLMDLNGGKEIVKEAQAIFIKFPRVLEAIDRLDKVATELLNIKDLNLNFDFGEVRQYGYHNGLIFAAYAAGEWQAIAKGGRYDDIGTGFVNKSISRPATGFSCNLNVISKLILSDLKENKQKIILCDLIKTPELISAVREYRKENIVIFSLETEANRKFTHKIVLKESNYKLEKIV